MKKAPLMKSTSGIRGIVGLSLHPENIVHYAAAFGRFLKQGKVVVGRDSRPSGEYYSQLICATLAMIGCDVVDVGIVPTPTVELAVTHHKAAGGIAITASHNPLEWNALKFFSSLGEFITKAQYNQLEKIASGKPIPFVTYDKIGSIKKDDKSIDRHIASVLKLKSIPVPKIRKAKLKVVVDAINGAGSEALPDMLEKIGVEVVRLNCKNDGDFFRKPEPVAENLTQLGRMVKRHKADAGLACDPDADRLALVDEKGRPIGEELTLTLAVAYYLLSHKGTVAINMSTSRATADVARMSGSKVYLSPVGEANVIAEMRKRKSVIGGEGNGGVILPESHYGRDALVAAGLVLAYMAKTKKLLSELAGTIPLYINIKKKAPLPAGFERKILQVEKRVTAEFGKIKIDRRDGLRFDLEEGWIQVRKSNTEPIYRLIVEARSQQLAGKFVSLVQKILK
ncbi:MAG: phosphoglucosamine mutase [candidate division Zixibacteria bacterium]|nr:phosphoglucosamine mutase [candidate division Zixibacteria bacterium]